jgi:hypothetical protein
MSFILGIKRGSAAYLLADTAMTGSQETYAISSFGESTVKSGHRSVQEGLLKITDFGTCAVAFAGDVQSALSVLEVMDRQLRRGVAPRDAFRSGIESNWPLTRRICLLLIIPQLPSPALLSFDSDSGSAAPMEHVGETVVRFGSIGPAYAELIRRMSEVVGSSANYPERHLVAMLGFLQMLTVRDPILAQGAGGAFCGLLALHDRILWQKDILWLVGEKFTSADDFGWAMSFCRDGVLFVRSSLSNSFRAFCHRSLTTAARDRLRRVQSNPDQFFVDEATTTVPDELGFGVILNTSTDLICVIPLRPESGTLRFQISRDDRGDLLYHFTISDSLRTVANDWRPTLASGGPLKRNIALAYNLARDDPFVKDLGIVVDDPATGPAR